MPDDVRQTRQPPLGKKVASDADASKRVRLPLFDRPRERADAIRNREKILNAARRLIKKRSIEDICMDAVADLAGVGKGTLYRRFKDRAALCFALLDDNERELQNAAIRAFDLPKSPALERLRVFVKLLLRFSIENAPLLAEARASSSRSQWDEPVYRWRRVELIRLMHLAQGEGGCDELDPETTAQFILATLEPSDVRFHLARGEGAKALEERYLRFWKQVLR